MRTGSELACVSRDSFSDITGNQRICRGRDRAVGASDESPRIWMERLEPRRMFSAPAHLDPTFGINGVALVPGGITASALAAGPGGKIYVAGSTFNSTGIDLFRINADGSPDASFGNNGVASCELGFYANGNRILVQPDGKVIVQSIWNDTTFNETTLGVLARFNTDGSVDSGFGNNGSVDIVCHDNVLTQGIYFANLEDTQVAATSLAADGKITVLSKDGTSIQLQRLNADGSPDTSFGPAGQRFVPLQSTPNVPGQDIFAGITPDGGYVVDSIYYPLDVPTWYFIPVKEFRFDSAGDLTSQTDLALPRDVGHVNAATMLPDGRVLFYRSAMGVDGADVGGNGPSVLAFGDVQTLFNGYPDVNSSLTVAPDGKIYVVGLTPHDAGYGAIQRFNADGSPDQTFSGGQAMGGLGFGGLIAVLPQSDGSVIVASQTEAGYNGFELFKALPGGPAGAPDSTTDLLIPPGQAAAITGASGNNGLFGNVPISVLNPSSGKRLLEADEVSL
jgi:uncharacterized delta-60 repeat protein